MDKSLIFNCLKWMSEKYSVVRDLDMRFEDGAFLVDCDKGSFRFVYDFAQNKGALRSGEIPLFHWRNKPRYKALRNLIELKMVETPRAFRIHHIVSKDEFTRCIDDIMVFETDLVEFIIRDDITKVFSDFSGEVYVNCIMSSRKNLKISLELGFSPVGSEPVLLHEIVACTGIVSDVAVDTQTMQYPIYVFNGEKNLHFAEIDAELYGLTGIEADCVRFIMDVLKRPESAEKLRKQYLHISSVCSAARIADRDKLYTNVEEVRA